MYFKLLCLLIWYINTSKLYKYINQPYTIEYTGTKIFIADCLYIYTHLYKKSCIKTMERAQYQSITLWENQIQLCIISTYSM